MKATQTDVVDVVKECGGSVERAEIIYQLEERAGLELDDGLIDKCVVDGELDENDGGFSLPGEVFEDSPSNGRPAPQSEPPPAPPEEPPEPDAPAEEPVEEPAAEEELGEYPPRKDRRARKGLGWTDEEIIERLRLWNKLTGAPPTKLDLNPAKLLKAAEKARTRARDHMNRLVFYQEGDWPSEATLRDHFGSFSAALVAAGFEARPTGRQPVGKIMAPKLFGQDSLKALWERLAKARDEGSSDEVRGALYDLGAAALTEADRIGK